MTIATLPSLALSVRQPWAWAIIHAGKAIENRSPGAVKWMSPLSGRRAIHASKGMTREEYEEGRDFMASIGVICPAPADLLRGGIIGSVRVVDCVRASDSKWFFGPRGLVLKSPEPCAFVAAAGALGYFSWKPSGGEADPPKRWMRRADSFLSPPDDPADLFGERR